MKKALLILASTFCLNVNAQYIYTVAGDATSGYSGDGGQATAAELFLPWGVTIDAQDNLYISDQASHRVRKVSTTGIINTFAGNGTAGSSGNGGQATVAELYSPSGMALDVSGNLYIADVHDNYIRKVNTSGVISTVAGNGTAGFSGDGGQATAAELWGPTGITFDAAGNLYIADYANFRIRKIIISTGIISTVAGNGTGGFSGDGGQATAAKIDSPYGVILDAAGNLYIADTGNQRIRKVNTSGTISTFAGNGVLGNSGDGGQATAAELDNPRGLACDAVGNLYIADQYNSRIRKINTLGVISTFAGNGTAGYSGDGAAATASELYEPTGVVFNSAGNLYIADEGNSRIREITINCPANAGPNVNVYTAGESSVCATVQLGTPAISGLTYFWYHPDDLNNATLAQPNTSYNNTSVAAVYTLNVYGSGCATNTSTVQVTTLTPTLTASLSNITAIPGSNITAVGTYTANFPIDYYYMSIKQCTATGGTITPSYSWDNGYAPIQASGYTFPFPNTSTLTCNTYYTIWFNVGSSAVCGDGVWATGSGTVFQIQPPANAGPNQTYTQTCTGWPSATIGTPPAISGMSYTWSPGTNLSPTNSVTATSSYTTTMTSQSIIYTLTVGYSGCTSSTSTVQVTAVKNPCPGCCREAEGIATQNQTTENFVVYPNPASGQVTLSLYDKAEYVQIIDMQGRLVFETKNIVAQEFMLDISKYTSGIYFIRAKIGDTIEKQKLVIE